MTPLTFRLLGQGIAYSASPAMMRAAFDALGLPHRYEIVDLSPADVPDAVEALRAEGIGGANVTTPHKLAVAALVDERSADVERIGAANTVVRDGDRLIGHNTDMPAQVEALERLCPNGVGRAVVLGSGGAARAMVLALEAAGATDISYIVRRDGSWGRMAERLATADLVVNATPVGSEPPVSPVPLELLRPDLAVLDLVYRPSPTRLVREARARGAPAEGGAAILLAQGWRSLELWLGRPAPIEAMRAALRAELGAGAHV